MRETAIDTEMQERAEAQEHPEEGKAMLFQFIDHETGFRSKPIAGGPNEILKILDARKEDEKPVADDYILLHTVLDGDNSFIPTTPLITVKTFIEANRPEEAYNG